MKHTIHHDTETFSEIDLKTAGMYKYAEHAEILLWGYSLDYGPVITIDFTIEDPPQWLIDSLTDENYTHYSANAAFERAIFNSVFRIYTPPEIWRCALVHSAMAGLPLSLDSATKALDLSEKKDSAGKALIRLFCIPIKPTQSNGMRTRNWPVHYPDKWDLFIVYLEQDVKALIHLSQALSWLSIPKQEHLLWCLTEKKNERGVKVDMQLIESAMIIDSEYRAELVEEGTKLTGLKNVNSIAQLSTWLEEKTGLCFHKDGFVLDWFDGTVPTKSFKLTKQDVSELLLKDFSPEIKRVLQIRQLMSRSSIKKYGSMKNSVGKGSRVRGMFQYYGANRTGREAGRLAQPQNFTRIKEEFQLMIDDVREIVKMRDTKTLHIVFDNISDVLAQLLRTTFIADEGKEFIVLDFSAIEAVLAACLADETWRIQFFKEGGDIYKASASMMFKTPIAEITKEQRSKGKIAELACGFGGSDGAIERMNDAIEDPKKRIPQKEISPIVPAWRTANPNIVQSWWDLDRAVKNTINTGLVTESIGGVRFALKKGNLLLQLPGKRCLVYQKVHLRKFYVAHIDTMQEVNGEIVIKTKNVTVGEVRNQSMREYNYLLNKKGLKDNGTKPNVRETICFWGQNQTTKRWEVIETYGPKIFENCLAGDTKVLTLRGKINIFDVTNSDLIWDGVEWVKCDGVINNGYRNTISINGVRMTEDHKILTENGWKNASSCEGLNRQKSSLPDNYLIRRRKQEKEPLECEMRLWKRKNSAFIFYIERSKILRLYEEKTDRTSNLCSWYERSSGLPCLEINAGSMRTTYSSVLSQLRRSRDNSLRKMVKVYSFLGRYGTELSSWPNFRSKRCERKLRERQLFMDNNETAIQEQEGQYIYRNTLGQDNTGRGRRTLGHRTFNNILQTEEQLSIKPFVRQAGLYEQVYDILNCGPHHQFVVFDNEDKPFIVHNCVQATARDLLMNAVINIEKAGYEVVMTIHDEIVVEVPKDSVSFNEIKRLMLDVPDYAKNWPIKADGFIANYYQK